MLETANPEGHIACSAAVRDFDSCEQLGTLRVPTLVISSTHDPATTPADGCFLREHIPGARYVELNAAHLSNVEDPGRFTRAVITFFHS